MSAWSYAGHRLEDTGRREITGRLHRCVDCGRVLTSNGFHSWACRPPMVGERFSGWESRTPEQVEAAWTDEQWDE